MTNAESQVRQAETHVSTYAGRRLPGAGPQPSPLGSFGDYELLDEIARGGMGVVYKARQRKLGRIVAVKMMLAGPLAGKNFVQRFRTESAAAAILQHPNIVAIHAVGVHEGRHYFSMASVDGRNLVQIVGQQPLPPTKAARYVELIAEAIHFAHERGILHRDLKPSNVLIDANGQPRVTDFGRAKKLDTESSLTISGQVLGSPNFLPPELAGAKRGKVGRPSDVYARGGILTYGTSVSGPRSVRWLEIHDASQFGALSGPSFLTQFAHRPDRTLDQSGPRSWTLRVYASTTSRSVAGLSTTFAQNLGTNNTLVFDGTVNVTTGNLPGPGNTRQFDYVFPFTTPLLYDPAAGNLVLSLQIGGSGEAVTFDTVSGNPAIGIGYGSPSTATTGTVGTPEPHVTQLTFEPPPLLTIRLSQVEGCWNSISNLTYQVQYRSDLTTNPWTSLVDCIRSTNSTSCVYDPIIVSQPQRFYRVVQTNCVP